MKSVHPDIINTLYDVLLKSKYPPSKKELIQKFCPSVSKYKDYILIRMFYMFDNTTTFSSNELLKISDFRKISWDEKIYFGSVNGDNSKVMFSLEEIIVGAIEDPYIIYSFIEEYKELVIQEGGYLHKYIEQYKHSNSEDSLSEEISDSDSYEESDDTDTSDT